MNKWDLYDKNFEKTNNIISENDNIPDELYHYTLNIWIFNDKNEILLFRNALNSVLYYPGFWGCIIQNVLSGLTPYESCMKTLNEILNLNYGNYEIKKVDTAVRDPYHYIYETYFVQIKDNISHIKLDDNYSKAKWVDKKELKNMMENGEISQILISRIEKYIFPILK